MQTGLVGFVMSTQPDAGDEDDDQIDEDQESHDDASGCVVEDVCCPDGVHPQHGPAAGLGCCASSAFGCCQDNMTPAPAPFFEVNHENVLQPVFYNFDSLRDVLAPRQDMGVVQMK